MKSLIVIGTGGHCRAIISIIRNSGGLDPLGIIDIGAPVENESIMGIPVIGCADLLVQQTLPSASSVILAIGDNVSRARWFRKVKSLSYVLPNLISKTAIIDSTARLGEGVVICPGAFVGPKVVIGDNVLVNTAAIVEHEVRVESHCHLSSGSVLAGRVTLGEYSFLGANSTVIDKVKLAERTTVGAGGVVINNIINPGATWVGVPVRKVD